MWHRDANRANGVGKINVVVSKDGETHKLEIQNGEEIGSFSEPGKYFIKITDEMGTTITKNFTITIKMWKISSRISAKNKRE